VRQRLAVAALTSAMSSTTTCLTHCLWKLQQPRAREEAASGSSCTLRNASKELAEEYDVASVACQRPRSSLDSRMRSRFGQSSLLSHRVTDNGQHENLV